MSFGKHIRALREAKGFSLRTLASSVGTEFGYLSRVERDDVPPPSETLVMALATALGEDADLLLAMAGKISPNLVEIICRRPQLYASLIRQLKDAPDHAILRIVREVRDGEW